jgi:hypothetical protein
MGRRMAQGPVFCPESVIGTPSQTIKIKKWGNGQMNSGNKKNTAAAKAPPPKPKTLTLMFPDAPTCPNVWG